MDDLIAALTIFRKYGNPKYPTHCEHDVLSICGIERDDVSDEDMARLRKLDFDWDEDDECFYSFRFGSYGQRYGTMIKRIMKLKRNYSISKRSINK